MNNDLFPMGGDPDPRPDDTSVPTPDGTAAPTDQGTVPPVNDANQPIGTQPSYLYYAPPATEPSKGNGKKGLNVASLVLGIVTWGLVLLCCGLPSPITAILSIIFAIRGRENKKFNDKGLAGLICSVVFLAMFVLVVAFFVLVIVFSEPSADYTNTFTEITYSLY